jgi:hypothetical protein
MNFRISAGDGGDANTVSDADTAVLSIGLPDSRIPLDGDVHEIAVFIYASSGSIDLFIDGARVGQGAATNSAFEQGQWNGGDASGFGKGYSSIARGGNLLAWPAGSSGMIRIWAGIPQASSQ